MSAASALQAINLVGHTVRPAHGSERWAFANGNPAHGRVVDVHIPDLAHPCIVCEFPSDTVCLYPFEVEVLTC